MNFPDTHGARAAILGALRASAPATAQPAPDLSPYLDGPYGRGSRGPRVDPATLIAPFEAAAKGWRAEVLHANETGWPRVVNQALAQRGCTRVAVGAASPLQPGLDTALDGLHVRRFDAPLQQWKAELFDAVDAGITAAEAGIADTGTLILRPNSAEPRTLSLVPPLHVAVLHASRLYPGLPAAMAAVTLQQSDMPTNLLLVTGPSKTADIQQVLAFGAHGPKELVIVLVNDLHVAKEPQ
ncbi:LutC/YkgG family protein [Azohydromonas lata]|uniref:LutC/YkgG family protein n=1 Tax=Azohydromonas lata TaxID=45677 RepID=UPI00082A148F|nr:lactate utilization protein C [Azohydromonas lata]